MTKSPAKSPQAFRSIGEVARLVGVATHVLRYWESQFPALSPVKRPDGRRYYRPEDVQLAAGLCAVMREDGLTIRGANLLISKDKGAALRARGRARLGEDGAEAASGSGGRRTRAVARADRSGNGSARGRAEAQGVVGELRAGSEAVRGDGLSGTRAARGAAAESAAEVLPKDAARGPQHAVAKARDSRAMPLFPDLFAPPDAQDDEIVHLFELDGEDQPADGVDRPSEATAAAAAAPSTSDSAPRPAGRIGDPAATTRAASDGARRRGAAGIEPYSPSESRSPSQASRDPRGAVRDSDSDSDSDSSILWLARLTTTAAALRTRRAPLPEGAAALAAALRVAHQPC